MRAIIFKAYGPPEVLHESIVAVPEVGPDKLLIEVKAAGVNPINWKIRKGNFRLVLDRTYPLEYAHAAHEYMEKGHAQGKVVLTV
jgi:NADPH:quinone reductase-like Zn-dependent oxidoreductase